MSVDTSKLKVGTTLKNYKELCSLLGEPEKKADSKQSQLKEWRRYFDFEKEQNSQKIHIYEIYDTPLDKEDGRIKGNNSFYAKYIEYILMCYLSEQEGYIKALKKSEWYEVLGLVNEKFYERQYTLLTAEDNKYLSSHYGASLTNKDISDFYMRASGKLNDTFKAALKSLKRRLLIDWKEQNVIIIGKQGGVLVTRVATEQEDNDILTAKKDVLSSMGYDSLNQLFFAGKSKIKEYYDEYKRVIKNRFGWKNTYTQFVINFYKEAMQREINKTKNEVCLQLVNSKFVSSIQDGIEKRHERNLKLKEQESDAIIEAYSNGATETEIAAMPNKHIDYNKDEAFVLSQQALASYLLKIDRFKNIPIEVLMEMYESNDFSNYCSDRMSAEDKVFVTPETDNTPTYDGDTEWLKEI